MESPKALRPLTLTWPQRLLILVLALYRVGGLAIATGIVGTRALHVLWSEKTFRVLTYLSLEIEGIITVIGAVGVFYEPVLRIYLLFLLPIAVELAVSVAFLICVVVWANEGVYTTALACYQETGRVHVPANASSMEFRVIHSRDFAVHDWPAIEQLLIVIATYLVTRRYTKIMWQRLSRSRRIFYVLYLVLASTLVIGLYGLYEDWKKRYSVPAESLVGTTMAIFICLVAGSFYAWSAWPGISKHAATRPLHATESFESVESGVVATMAVLEQRGRGRRRREMAVSVHARERTTQPSGSAIFSISSPDNIDSIEMKV